jgi:uncharacterized protein
MSRRRSKLAVVEPVDAALVEYYARPPSWRRYAALVRLASSAGNAWATYVVARWYLHGFAKTGVRRDIPTAIRLLRRAARSSPHAMVELALCHEDGIGVSTSYARARALLERAASSGSVYARVHLAWMFGNGVGVRRDETKARRLMREAARFGVVVGPNEQPILDGPLLRSVRGE